MKICAIICEYNPFHNGHRYHIQEARRLSNADFVLCIMSGNFVQRGEAAVLEKHLRAKHAVLAGADAVIELPAVFATSNAELFAKGAIKILSAIPEVTHLCFGAETANKEDFLTVATLMNHEPKDVSLRIKELTSQGISYAKARSEAFSAYLPKNFSLSPNNLLGVEYTKALLDLQSKIEILPLKRLGSNYNDCTLQENFSSASAIRLAIQNQEIHTLKSNLPEHSLSDLKNAKIIPLETFEKLAILAKSKESLANVCDCTEGLENAFKRIAEENSPDFVAELTSARYTASRIKRIALHALLNIEEREIRTALQASLYLRILCIRKENERLLSILGKTELPLLVKNSDEKKLDGVALSVFEKEKYADCIYAISRGEEIIAYSPFL